MKRRSTQRAAARQRKSFVYRQSPGAVRSDRLRARSLRVESLENRCLLAGDALASIDLVAVDSQGTPLTHVDVGDAFVLQAIVRDLRPDPAGVFAAYTDVTFDAGLASATGPLTRADAFSGGLPEDSASPGEFSEVGGFRPQQFAEGSGATAELLFSVPMVASAAGELLLAANPADDLPQHDVLLLGQNEFVPQDQIECGYLRLQIGDPVQAPPSPWRNPANPFDVNNDGAVDASDVQQLQAEIDRRAGQTSLDPTPAGAAPYFDVTGDRLVTPDDLAAVQQQLPAARPAPGQPDDDTVNDILAKINPWLDADWPIELRVTNGFNDDPVTSARVGDILHVNAILHIPDDQVSVYTDLMLANFSQTDLAYDPTKLQMVGPLTARYTYQPPDIDPAQDPAGFLEAMKHARDQLWLVGASFVVLQAGSVEFSTLPQGTQPAAGLQTVASGAKISDTLAANIEGSSALQDFAAQFGSKIQEATATVDLSAAGTRPTAQNDTYDLTDYSGALIIDKDHGVLSNDGAGDGAQALLVRPAAHGTVTVNPDGSFRYAYGFDRMNDLSDTFAYVVVNQDGTSDFTEVEIRADKIPPIAQVSVRAVDGLGQPLESVHVGQHFILQAVVTDLRGEGPSYDTPRGASQALIDVGFSSDTLKAAGPVQINYKYDGKHLLSGPAYTKVWSELGPDEVVVRGVSNTGPESGTLEIFRVPMVATAEGAATASVDTASLTLRPNLTNIPDRLVQLQGFSLQVLPDPSTLRAWSNSLNPLDVTGDGFVAAADALAIINELNAFGARLLPATLAPGRLRVDADADNYVSASDVLAVINYLNSHQTNPEGESSSVTTVSASDPSATGQDDVLAMLAADTLSESRRRR